MPIDNDPFSGMSPTDALKLRLELDNRKVVTPEQKAANGRKTLSDVLGMLPIVGNAMSAYDAYGSAGDAKQAFSQGQYGRGTLAAALTGVSTAGALSIPGAGRLARAIAKSAPRTLFSGAGPTAGDSHRYFRHSRSEDHPFNDVGYGMFVDTGGDFDRFDNIKSYGPHGWTAQALEDAVPAESLADDAFAALERRDLLPQIADYGTGGWRAATVDDIRDELTVDDIVNSAKFFDNPEWVSALWEDVLEPSGIRQVVTPDGLIAFTMDGVKKR